MGEQADTRLGGILIDTLYKEKTAKLCEDEQIYRF